MHDGKYCLVSDHWLYTTFRDALWDTLNALYRLKYFPLDIQTARQNEVVTMKCTI